MEKIETVENLPEEEVETLFRERTTVALEKMGFKPFVSIGLELARSEKEIAKCIKLVEKAKHKSELKKRDSELSAEEKESKELTAGERRRKNKKTTKIKPVPIKRSPTTSSQRGTDRKSKQFKRRK